MSEDKDLGSRDIPGGVVHSLPPDLKESLLLKKNILSLSGRI